MREIGRVLWFDVKKGYGFVRCSSGLDVFVHYSKIDGELGEFRLLEENDEVEFELFYVERGSGIHKPQAKNVRLLRGANEVLSESSNDAIGRFHNRTEANSL